MNYNNWKIYADTYTARKEDNSYDITEFKSNNSPESEIFVFNNGGEVVTTRSLPETADFAQASVLTSSLSDSPKHIVFSLDDMMSFGDNDSYNGCVSFAFLKTKNSLNLDENKPLISTVSDMSYSAEKINALSSKADKTGGIAPWFWDNDDVLGFTLTLYPHEGKTVSENERISDQGTRNVSYYKLSVKNRYSGHEELLVPNKEEPATFVYDTNFDVITYEDYLPESIDLGKVTSLTVDTWRDDYVRIFLNGMELVSFAPLKISDNLVNDAYKAASTTSEFIMSCVGGKGSPVNFRIYALNGISAYDASTANQETETN